MNNQRDHPASAALEQDVAHYLATGESDPIGRAFPGRHALESITGYERHLRKALIEEVCRREGNRRQNQVPPDFNPTTCIQDKLQRMIVGLFPAIEQQAVFDVAKQSIIFLTRDNTHLILRQIPYLESAWTLANIYLHSLRAPTLGDGSYSAVGCNEETRCYVSMEYFAEKNPLADYVVHEVAHIFHNCKRATLGFAHTRKKEWLLDLAFAKRETFAYACEVYSRILEKTRGKANRCAFLAQHANHLNFADNQADKSEVYDILVEAVEARNGWKRILARCSKSK